MALAEYWMPGDAYSALLKWETLLLELLAPKQSVDQSGVQKL
jgi:hypothetical protein